VPDVKSRENNGVRHVGALSFLLATLIVVAGCDEPAADLADLDLGGADSPPPRLMNLGLSLAPSGFDSSSKSFYEFYGLLGADKRTPAFEYRIRTSVPILAPVAGTVEIRSAAGGEDSAIFIYPDGSTGWLVFLDHVTNVQVSTGAHVTAGQTVGSPGIWHGVPGIGRTELQVNTPQNDHYCPVLLLDNSVRASIEAEVRTLMSAIETARRDGALYDENAMIAPGCLRERFVFVP
jgi:hypothetical protein